VNTGVTLDICVHRPVRRTVLHAVSSAVIVMKWSVLAVCLVSYLAHCTESTPRLSTTHDVHYLLPTNERVSDLTENLVRTLSVDLIRKMVNKS